MDEALLRAAWARDAGSGRGSEEALAALLGRYAEPHRRYHTAKHLSAVLLTVDDLVAQVGVPDPTAVRLGAWFHDAVYDPKAAAGANEAASAALATRVLDDLGHRRERCDAVARLVLVTAGHQPGGGALDEAVLVDADLAVLGERPAVYEAYRTGVRAEYAHVSDEAWRTGRRAVLRSFLDRPRLYVTEPMATRDPQARANLTAELAALAIPTS